MGSHRTENGELVVFFKGFFVRGDDEWVKEGSVGLVACFNVTHVTVILDVGIVEIYWYMFTSSTVKGYEVCHECGFDHEYEPAEAQHAHAERETC